MTSATERVISVFGSRVGPEELEQVRDCFDRQWLGTGPKNKEFETRFAAHRRLPNLALVNSGSNALYLAVALLDLPPGSDVIVPSFTWIACAHAILMAGHRPVFCDVALDTHNATAETVQAAMTPKTRAVMVVHYAGKPVRLQQIIDLGLPVIEDAAHAVASDLRGEPCGGIGDVGVFSFDAVKNLAMGEGGGVTAREAGRAERARVLRYCGIAKSGFEAATGKKERWWEYEIGGVFPKLLVSDVAAAIGLAQLAKLERHQAMRKRVWEIYQRQFADLEWLVRPAEPEPDETHSYFTYVVRLPRRDESARILLDRGIYTTLRYHPLHLSPIYGAKVRLPNTERLGLEALSLPLHPNLSEADVERVVSEVRSLPSRLR